MIGDINNISRGKVGEMAKEQAPFKIPENHEAEPALHDNALISVSSLLEGPSFNLGCEEALEVSQVELDIQLDYFSRRLDMKYYDNALKIYAELKKMG